MHRAVVGCSFSLLVCAQGARFLYDLGGFDDTDLGRQSLRASLHELQQEGHVCTLTRDSFGKAVCTQVIVSLIEMTNSSRLRIPVVYSGPGQSGSTVHSTVQDTVAVHVVQVNAYSQITCLLCDHSMQCTRASQIRSVWQNDMLIHEDFPEQLPNDEGCPQTSMPI